jgi:CDK inhibitor PHO81
VGGAVETYWKSTTMPISSMASPLSTSRWLQHTSSAHTSPSNLSAAGAPVRPALISSLRGSYVYAVIQVTRDCQPVVYSHWRLVDAHFDLGVADVTLEQFEALAKRLGKDLDLADEALAESPGEAVKDSMLSLTQLLKVPILFSLCRECF